MKHTLSTPVCAMLAAVFVADVFAQPHSAGNSKTEETTLASETIEVIVVTGTPQSRYIVETDDPTSGLTLDFLENPRNSFAIPEQLILDRKITDLNEALRSVPGFAESDGYGGTNDDFFLRGFRRNVVYRDGFRRETNYKTNLTNVEFTQVVRGAASITYGQVEPGGLVDIVTKKPLDTSRLAGEFRYGRFDDSLALIDWSQVLTDNIGVRLVASTQNAESFRDFYETNRDAVALSSRFDLSADTQLNVSYEWRDEARPLDRGTITVPVVGGGRSIINELVDIPTSRRFGEPFESADTEFNFININLRHNFNNTWSLAVNAATEHSDSNDLQARPRAVFIYDQAAAISDNGFFHENGGNVRAKTVYEEGDRVFLSRRTDGNRERRTNVSYLNALLKGEFNLQGINHRIALGADYRDSKRRDRRLQRPTSDGISIPFLNIQNPIYGQLTQDTDVSEKPLRQQLGEDYGVFVNHYIDVTDQLGVLLGLRYSETVQDTFVDGIDLLGSTSKADAVIPQVGFSYRPIDWLAIFASYSESFLPNEPGLEEGRAGVIIDPERGEQYELGLKAELIEGRVNGSIVLYDIQKTNVVLGEDENETTIVADGQSSRGIELLVRGQPTPGMNLIAAYAYTDAEIPAKTIFQSLSGSVKPNNVPKHTVSLYGSYEVQGGTLEGLGFGAGVFHSGNRYGTPINNWRLGNYTLVDGSVWYTLSAPELLQRDGTIRLQLAIKNLFDENYYAAAGQDLRVNIGAPRTFIGSVAFEF